MKIAGLPIEFDDAKDELNRRKHGYSLADALQLDWETALVRIDARRDYSEARMQAIVYLRAQLVMVVYVDRPADAPTVRRVISLRAAHRKERQAFHGDRPTGG